MSNEPLSMRHSQLKWNLSSKGSVILPNFSLVLQGSSDGSLAIVLNKVRSQPQIIGAYKRSAPMRNRESVMEACAALKALQASSTR